MSGTGKDVVTASTMITSPVWTAFLSDVNVWLTSATLILGLIIAAHRVMQILGARARPAAEQAAPDETRSPAADSPPAEGPYF